MTDAGLDHFYKVMRAMGQWEMLDEPSPKVNVRVSVCGSLTHDD